MAAVIDWVNDRPRPLGLDVITEDEDDTERILDATNSGDACVNDCSVRPLVSDLPFGGVGNSGMGKYHGRWGSEVFINARGVLFRNADRSGRQVSALRPRTPRECEVMDKLL